VLLLENGIVSKTLAFALDAIATLWMLLVTLRERICTSAMNSIGEIGLEFYGSLFGGDGAVRLKVLSSLRLSEKLFD